MGTFNPKPFIRKCILVAMILLLTFIFAEPITPAASLWRGAAGSGLDAASLANPLAYPEMLPVFNLIPPPVDNTSVEALLRIFGGISNTGIITDTTPAGTVRFRGVDPEHGAVLDQFKATGGVFAYNITQAFMETPANLDYGPNQICDYLQTNALFPQDITPEATNCQGMLPYANELIYMNTLGVDGPASLSGELPQVISNTVQVIGQIWHIPLAIDVSTTRQPVYIPLGGPGGHLSLLLTGYDQRPPIDNDLPGLQAISMPWYQRQHQVIGYYNVTSPQLAAQQLVARTLSLMPTADVNPGTPELVYYVGDPMVEQKSLAPAWIFPDATAIVDGQVVNLKVSAFPGVEGFFPQVDILSPSEGAAYLPDEPLDVQAKFTGDAAPFTYTLSLEDGTPLKTGTVISGTFTIQTTALPAHPKNQEPDIRVILSIVDTNGALAEDQVMLTTPTPWVFLPVLQNQSTSAALTMDVTDTALAPVAPLSAGATRKMGVEWIRYYNGTNNDLPGVPADGNGFYTSMQSLGWSGRFKWTNNSAWEKDWRDCSLGGGDCIYGVENAEFAYFSGHGGPATIYFGVSKDNLSFFGGNARYQNVRWAAFSSCQTLRAGPYVGTGNPPLTYWFPAFQGAYMLLGFHSNMADIAFGAPFVDMMNGIVFSIFPIPKPPIRDAWAMTAFMYNAGKPAYLYARSNTFNPANLRLPTSSSSLPPLLNIIEYRWVWWE